MLSFKNVFSALDETRHFESVEHAVFDYQVNQTDSTFAYIFLEVYRIAASLQNKYCLIDSQDLISTAMSTCHEAILDYDCTNLYFKNGAKFSTLYTKYLSNALSSQMKSLNYNNRVLNIKADRYDIMIDNGFDVEENFDFSATELLSSLPKTLTDIERKYCEIILTNHNVDDTDVAMLLNISNVSVTRMKKKLQEKLNFLVA